MVFFYCYIFDLNKRRFVLSIVSKFDYKNGILSEVLPDLLVDRSMARPCLVGSIRIVGAEKDSEIGSIDNIGERLCLYVGETISLYRFFERNILFYDLTFQSSDETVCQIVRTSFVRCVGVGECLIHVLVSRKNIIWGTDSFSKFGDKYGVRAQMSVDAIQNEGVSDLLQPRVFRNVEVQKKRTKNKAEVFTPAWVCNKMNNYLDADWFGRDGVFNTEDEDENGVKTWVTRSGRIDVTGDKSWEDYVLSPRLEITCGEAPFIVSRYDMATGNEIPIFHRIGLLDRKLRLVWENAVDDEWLGWVLKALQSVYGYEWQGDNLLFARINVFLALNEHCRAKFGCDLWGEKLDDVLNIICWNFWQMDGLKNVAPLIDFDNIVKDEYQDKAFLDVQKMPVCNIRDWQTNEVVSFDSLKENK